MTSTSHQSDGGPAPQVTNDSPTTNQNLSSFEAEHATLSKRPEVLRYVLSRSTTANELRDRLSASKVKSERRRHALSSIRHPKSRVALQRVINSLFTNPPTRTVPKLTRVDSTASSARSRAGSFQDSVPSVDVVSPGTFLFSGPSLKSTYSASINNSRSRAPSLTGTDSGCNSFYRAGTGISAESFNFFDDAILEPAVEHGIVRSLSDVLLGYDTIMEDSTDSAFEDMDEEGFHSQMEICEKGLARDAQRDALTSVLRLPYLTIPSLSLRSTCRASHGTLPPVSQTIYSPCNAIPTELLQQIYSYLHPKDFNAARHTCRSWMRDSLNECLLKRMLERGGWISEDEKTGCRNVQTQAEPMDLDKMDVDKMDVDKMDVDKMDGDKMDVDKMDGDKMDGDTIDVWPISQRLSRECALSAGWKGNGLTSSSHSNAIVAASDTDFADLLVDPFGTDPSKVPRLLFTMSSCGRRLLAARGTLVYVYDIESDKLRPLSIVPCPRNVVAMSIDATEGSNAFAALLEGQMGIMCKLGYGQDLQTVDAMDLDMGTHTYSDRRTTTSYTTESRLNLDAAERHIVDRISIHQHADFTSVHVQANYDEVTLQGTDDHHIIPSWNLTLRGKIADSSRMSAASGNLCVTNIPVESGKCKLYHKLGTIGDGPTSVSICPGRECVAFACSSGVHLHWTDSRNADHSRWFPLTVPSDFLYFISPRSDTDSANKLRLISSAAHPSQRVGTRLSSGEHSNSHLVPSRYDHYRAVPLSDGHHILFTDPSTSWVFLGCNAPLGGPTKLLRKVLLKPPAGNPIPQMYTAATDLTRGARIVVVFDDTLLFYSVPADVLALSTREQTSESLEIYTRPPFTAEGRSRDHWLDWWENPLTQYQSDSTSPWPLAIDGTEIGALPQICDLAVKTEPDITIWAFTQDGLARMWCMRNQGRPPNSVRRYACRDGVIHDVSNSNVRHDMDDGDTIMIDPGELCSSLDGCTSPSTNRLMEIDENSSERLVRRIPNALSVENDDSVWTLGLLGDETYFDTNGDVFVLDVKSGERLQEGQPLEDWSNNDYAASWVA